MSQQSSLPEPVMVLLPHDHDPKVWQTYWQVQGQPWRTEPEISQERQAELLACLSIAPDVYLGIYPFKHKKLDRADIEWLLANHENGRGPVDYSDKSQRDRVGLDLRGADLSHTQLQNLPLARTVADVSWRTWTNLTEEQHYMAAVLLESADLKGAHLEGAGLEYARMNGADLRYAHLQDANLGTSSLQSAYLEEAHLEGVNLMFANLQKAFLWGAYVGGANLREAHLDGAHLNRINLCNEKGEGPYVADTLWGNANLAVVPWTGTMVLGDEYGAQQLIRTDRDAGVVEQGYSTSTSSVQAQQARKATLIKDQETRLRELRLAVRANRQLALALQAQGLNEEAARFSYRAQVLYRQTLWQQGPSRFHLYLFSLFLAALTGYGYRMGRIIIAYTLVNVFFASLYYFFGRFYAPQVEWMQALLISITAFHGRVFSNIFLPGSPQNVVTACEAVTGLIFEGIFIAMLTQKFFGR